MQNIQAFFFSENCWDKFTPVKPGALLKGVVIEWSKLVQAPADANDPKAMALLRGLLVPLTLRRTKDTLGSDGAPILTLPPADIRLVELDPTDEECDFYQALFRRYPSSPQPLPLPLSPTPNVSPGAVPPLPLRAAPVRGLLFGQG